MSTRTSLDGYIKSHHHQDTTSRPPIQQQITTTAMLSWTSSDWRLNLKKKHLVATFKNCHTLRINLLASQLNTGRDPQTGI